MSSAQQEGTPAAPATNDNSRLLFAVLCFGGAGYALFAPWLVTAGPKDSMAHVAAYMQFLTTPWMMGCYAVTISLIAFGVWHLHTSRKRATEVLDIRAAMRRQTIRLSIAWLLVTISLVLIGVLYLMDLRETSREERARQHESIASLKAQQVTKWLAERTTDAELLATALRGIPLERLSTDRELKVGIELLFAQLMAGHPERVSVSLLAPDGKVLVTTGGEPAGDPETIKAAKALATGQPMRRQSIVDIHFGGTPPTPMMAFLVPVTEVPGRGPAVAVLAIAVNPFKTLIPEVASWPTPSPSSEVLVVRREGDEVVFITPPKPIRPAPAPLAYKVPLASKFPTAEAVAQGDGVRFSLSSRGVEVLTASRRVSGLPWIVIAKTDLDEIDETIDRKRSTLIIVIGAAAILAALLLVVLWRGEYASILAFRNKASNEQVATAENFARLTRYARDITLLVSSDGRIVEANEAAAKAYGYTAGELRRLTVRDLQAAGDAGAAEHWRAAATSEGVLFETVHRRKDGAAFPVEVNALALHTGQEVYRQAFVRDITGQEELKREVSRLREQAARQGS